MKFLTVLLASLCIALAGCSSVTKVGKFTWSISIDEPVEPGIPIAPDAGDVSAE